MFLPQFRDGIERAPGSHVFNITDDRPLNKLPLIAAALAFVLGVAPACGDKVEFPPSDGGSDGAVDASHDAADASDSQ